MLETIRKGKTFIVLLSIFASIGILIIFLFSKEQIHIEINKFHNVFFDFFFKYITHLGSGWLFVLAFFVLLFVRFRFSLIIALSGIVCGIVIQFLKRFVFSDVLRPVAFFKDSVDIRLVPGVEMANFNSFPSGHSAAAFCLFFCLAIFYADQKKYIGWLCFVLALLIAFSRTYLSQHFFEDIVTGSLIGFCVSFIFLSFCLKTESKFWNSSIKIRAKRVKGKSNSVFEEEKILKEEVMEQQKI